MSLTSFLSVEPKKLIKAIEEKDLQSFLSLQPTSKELKKNFDYNKYKKCTLLHYSN